MPSNGEGVVEHYADSYDECLELALTSPTEAVRNTHSLQYFALDVYAYDIALPNDGCTGKTTIKSDSSISSISSTEAASTATPPSATTMTTSAGTVSYQMYFITVSVD